jgi:UDP-4-amino-4-deoxy-L-arabinose formyltransferase/UDP-glucuronic acid dehydrogenase (UDP-4-keto-hexauronic acid decarboxylating)
MNWSLIQGKDKFITNLFRHKPGIDDGDIVATQEFDLNVFDNARTCHYKNTLSMIRLLEKQLPLLIDERVQLTPQADIPPTYYPRRTAEDGIIFWDRDSTEIYNLVRAVTHPFPGAFTFRGDEKVTIWKAQPFDTRLFSDYAPAGTVMHVFANSDFVVRTGSDTLLVTEYDGGKAHLKSGDLLHSGSYSYSAPYIYPLPGEEHR